MPGEPQGESAPEPRTLAEKVEWLIRHMWPADQAPAESSRDVAEAISAATGEDLSYSLIWKLRTGRGVNPTFKVLTALSTFFKVPIGYFGDGDEAESIGDQVALLALMREKGVTRASLRSLAGMSPEGREMIADMIETVARREQQRSGGTSGSEDA